MTAAPWRPLAVIASVAFALLAPAVQSAADLGLSAAAFSASGDQTLRAAGYAFSIWGLIYAGLVAYAAYQGLPAGRRSPQVDAVAWPSVVAITGCGAWICASALDWKWATVAIITVSALAMIHGLSRARAAGAPTPRDRWLVLWPLAGLAGWLTVASAINILTVLTAVGLIGPERAVAAGLVGVLAVCAAATGGLWATRLPAYGLPIAWGLVAVWVAERADNAAVALAALAGAVLVAVGALFVTLPSRPR